LARTCGWTMASELRACGIDLSFAPVVDVDLGLCGVIGDRACHRDPRAVSEISQAYIGGMHEAGMKATAKHFPGHGGVIGDAHPTRPVDQRDYKRLAGGIKPYRALIAAGLESIMMAPVSYPAVDDRPACFSIAWIQGELRGRFGFSGAIFSPVLTARASPDTALGRLAKSAQEAGCDVIVLSGDRDEIEAAGERLEICTPVSQVRRARLHGGRAPAWQRLRMSPGWREARVALESLQSSPELELDGGPGTAG
ncbi:MAG: beta-N-acetylhexosaminidase, partial [Gammaproteobacteria bacterium]|nr:beta-N-acetylhexosaminidase [Gammaproteobacteria bacterium]